MHGSIEDMRPAIFNVCVDYHAGTPSRPHPVWGTPDPDVAKYIRLLQYLCGEELMRLRVWTDPLRHADSSRAAPVVRSSRLTRLCSSCCNTPSTPQETCTGPSKVAREGLCAPVCLLHGRLAGKRHAPQA
jgi:hypothetical protein